LARLYKGLLIVLLIVLLVTFSTSMYYYNRMLVSPNYVTYVNSPVYFDERIALILENSNSTYWQRFKNGVLEAAKNYNIAVEFHAIQDQKSAGTQLRIAAASKKNAVITNSFDENTYLTDLEYLDRKGVEIITSGIELGKNNYFVGTNAFEFGQRAAQLSIRAGGENAQIAIILDNATDEIAGFSTEIQQFENASIIVTRKTDGLLIGAVDVIHSILNDYPEVNLIFAMTAEDTLAAAQAIVDRNLVGNVIVVGTDLTDTPIVRRYMQRNIIYGFIERNPYDAGVRSLQIVAGIIDGEFKPTYETIDIDTVTRWDLSQQRN